MTKKLIFLPVLVLSTVQLFGATSASVTIKKKETAVARPADVAPDLATRFARFQKVEMPFSMDTYSPRERHLIEELIAACRDLEDIYWRQNDPQDIALYNGLAASKDPQDQMLRHFLWINGSRYDLVDENRPFIGKAPMPPGASLYPVGLTRDDIETYVKAHPAQKDSILGDQTVVRGTKDHLRAVPYHEAFAKWLTSAAAHLRKAADYSDDKAFANFLRLRAKALTTDNYYESDVAWVHLENPKFDIIFAPYETYLDNLMGIKTSYGAAVMIRNEAESQKLAVFQKYVADLQDSLPLAREDLPSKKGKASPMEVMDTPFRAGDLRHGYQAVADNLPNDPRIHVKYGSKKLFFKNFMDARVNYVILPLAKRMMRPEQAAMATGEGYLASTMMHEICHGLGPSYARVNGKEVDIRQAIGAAYSGLEEAKADVTGMLSLKWLIDHDALPKERLREYYASYVAGIFRTLRFGTGEAHGRAEMMEFNYLSERGAVVRDPATGRYSIDFDKMPDAIASVAKELLEQEATGDRARAEAWFTKYDVVPPELKKMLDSATDVPVDIDPMSSLREGVQ